ncbi:MAG: hypothetical protein ABFD08_14410 [Syntrophomonas sp.]
MREYWQLDFYIDNHQKTRYLYGTEAAARRRARRYEADRVDLRRMSKSKTEYLKTEKKVHIINL